MEIVEEESPEVHKSVLDDPSSTRDVSSRGRSKVTPISASLGAMRTLIGKLDMFLLAPPQGCSSKRVKDGMRLLKDDVEMISSYLDELSEVEDPPPTANCWMNEARNLSYDMEDYIDSLTFSQPEVPSLVPNNTKVTKYLRKLPRNVKAPKTQAVIAEKLSEFKMYVQEAIERHQSYNLHSCSTLRRRFVSLGPMLLPTSCEETADIVIDGRMNEFINSLANDEDQQLKVLSILGPSCLGKTTLARVLYNRFGKQYHCRAFIRVSKKPDMKRIFHDMLLQLQRQDPPQDCEEIVLIDNIKKYLQDKRYLIILDDVLAASVWDIINHAFPDGSHGSRIITTTHIQDVALTCCCYQSEHVFEMKPLDDDHSRKLFFSRLCGSASCFPDQFKEVLYEIVEICGGLPLATVSIASLLASQPAMTIDLLTYIHQSLRSCFSASYASEITRQALKLNFNNLPHYLKTCLLYLSMYPVGYVFFKDDLVKQWVAERFIDTRKGQYMEEVAGSYLEELIGRRFIQPIRRNYNNEVLSCAVHDVVHDLIAHKSAEDNFIVAIDYSQKNVALSHKTRRLSLLFGDARYAKTPSNIRKSQVRSLSYSGLLGCMPSIGEFKLLRVLNLQLSGHGFNDDNPVDLSGISELFQLIYLKIACGNHIKLPNHVLQHLETLDIKDASVIVIPLHIHFPHLLNLSLRDERNLQNWIDEASYLGKLEHLQDLCLTFSSARFLSQGENMLILWDFISRHDNLKTIVVACGSSANQIGGPSEATISWDNMAPLPLLQRFEFSPHSPFTFSRISPWVEKHGNLCVLKIAVWELGMDCVDILRALNALTTLSLYVETAPVDKIIFDMVGFSVLKYLKLRFTSGIARLKFEAGAMPNLWKLKLVFNAIPSIKKDGTALISIEHMPGLKEISTKFGGAAADLEYASKTLVSNHPSNPTINMPPLPSWFPICRNVPELHLTQPLSHDMAASVELEPVSAPVRPPRKARVVGEASDEDEKHEDRREMYSSHLQLEVEEPPVRDVGTEDEWTERNPSLIRLTGKHPLNCEPQLARLMHHGFITPAPLHYVRNHGDVPRGDWYTWTVEVAGLVRRRARFTMDELAHEFLAMELPVTLVSAGNRCKEQNMVRQTAGFNWGAAGASTSVWRGVRLRDILRRCGVMKGHALHVRFEGAEDLPGGGGSKYGTSVTREWALDRSRDIMLAYAQNGEPLLPDHGFPVRVIIPGCIGGRMVKWVKRIVVAATESDNYYHFNNRVLPSHIDAELADAQAWWYKPEYIINELNTNSVITTPGHDEVLLINAFTTQHPYTMKGYAYSGGGKKITRVEVTLDGGETWMLCTLDIPEKPNKYGMYWCWCFWSIGVEVLDLFGCKEVAVRAWDQTQTTQPEKLTWNLMGVMNNCWFKVKVNVCRPHKGEIGLVFEHPTQPGNQTGGWMARQKHMETAAPGLKRSTSTPFNHTTDDKQFTMSEVRKHGSQDSAWIVVHGHVYDCTAFLKDHPGGADSILINAGTDCTEEFDAIHSDKAKALLDAHRIGQLITTGAGYNSDNSVHGGSSLAPIREATKAAAAVPIALSNPREKVRCRLVGKKELSRDVRLFRFALPSPDQVLGLPVGKHIFVCANIEEKLCMRPYTPTSMVDEVGQFELLVKVYFKNEHPKFPDGGVMTQYMESLQVGSSYIDVKGPLGHVEYTGRCNFTIGGKLRRVRRLAMICGGSGITPMYQVIQAVLRDQPGDETEMHLVYANRSEDDILLRDELDRWAAEYPDRLKVWYVIDQVKRPEEGWKYSVGHVREDILRSHVPEGGDDTLALACGPPPMIKFAIAPNLEKMKYDMANSFISF